MSTRKIQPHLLFAAPDGQIYDHPDLLMVCRKGAELTLPRPDELMPLPAESELFLLPSRSAVGFDPETGALEAQEEAAVAAFVSPGHTLSAQAAYVTAPRAPRLPLFAYGAVGYANGKLWVCARKVDDDPRQIFTGISPDKVRKGAEALCKAYPKNRLVRHLTGCALSYGCPAAKNLTLGRYEAPLPTARACNARCLGCISLQPKDSGFPATQNRIGFTPTVTELVEVMAHHAGRASQPILSFGQGCEGEPLTEAAIIAEAVAAYRTAGGAGTVNINTNASLPAAMEPLAVAGMTSLRVSLNSARQELYTPYYRPANYTFADVRESIRRAKALGLWVSLNYLFFAGVNDTEAELAALTELIQESRVDFVQLRNLNLDPELYMALAVAGGQSPAMGLANFQSRLRKDCPWLGFGYFNPAVAGASKASPGR